MKIFKTKNTFLQNTVLDADTGCMNWQHYKNADGYGRMSFNRKVISAHRFSYKLFIGDIPEGLIVRHKCHNPPCCNPNHLLIGTQLDNIQDMVNAGRHLSPKKKKPKPPHFSALISAKQKEYWARVKEQGIVRMSSNKLNEDTVKYIRQRAKEGIAAKEMALEYEMTPHAIRHIINRKTWRHVC
jgi:hypothetical protein